MNVRQVLGWAWAAVVALGFSMPGGCAASPMPAPVWRQAGWGGGGLFWSVAFDSIHPNVIYMGGDVGGIYKTTDDGLHWRMINNGLSGYAVYSLAVAPGESGLLYAGTTVGVCRSADGGAHWQALPETSKLGIVTARDKSVHALAVDPHNGNIVYAGTPSGKIFKTTDGGQSWRLLYTMPPGGCVSAVAISQDRVETILAATTAGVLVSHNSGATWQPTSEAHSADTIAASASDPNVLYAGGAGFYTSTDGGQNWHACKAGDFPQGRVVDIVVNPHNPQHVCCITTAGWNGNFSASSDGGKTWTTNGQEQADENADPTLPDDPGIKRSGTYSISKPTNLAMCPTDPKRLFISGNWRPCYSGDGGRTWAERDQRADISVVYDIRFHGPQVYVGAMDEGVLTSADSGAHWRQLWPRTYDPNISGHNWRLAVWNHNGTTRILSTCSPWNVSSDCVIISDDDGKTYTAYRHGLPETRPMANTLWGQGYLRALAPDPHNPNVLYAGIDGGPSAKYPGGGIFKSTDGGEHWQALPHQPPSHRMFFALAVDPTDSQRLYWGTCGPNGGLYRSDDGGGTWTRIFSQETWVFNVLITHDGTVYCPGTNLWRSTDHGQTWAELTHNPSGQIVGLETDPAHPDTLWYSSVTWDESSHGGIFQTKDGGTTWANITGSIPYHKPLILRYNSATHTLWAGGVGLYTLSQ